MEGKKNYESSNAKISNMEIEQIDKEEGLLGVIKVQKYNEIAKLSLTS